MSTLIDRDTIQKNAYLPLKLAELSYLDPDEALRLLREWGEGKSTIKKLWEDITSRLGEQDKST